MLLQNTFLKSLLKLLSSNGVAVLVELSVPCNIHIGKNERGRFVSDVSPVHALVLFQFSENSWLNL